MLLLIIILSTYKQMCTKDKLVLSNINEDNFDKVFDVFKPGGWSSDSKTYMSNTDSAI